MITKLHVKNIGPMIDEVITLSRLTKISGPNSAGKSLCVYQALEATLTCSSFSFKSVRKGQKSGSIHVYFEDGREVVRSISKSETTYTLIEPNKEPVVLTGTKNIQERVQNFTRFKDIKFGEKTTPENFQFVGVEQAQIHYLLQGSSPETVLAKLSAITGGIQIPSAKKQIESNLRKAVANKEFLEKEIQSTEQELSKYDQESIDKLKENVEKLKNMERTIKLAEEFVSKHSNADKILAKYENDLDTLQLKADQAVDILDRLANQITLIESISDKIVKICDLDNKVDECWNSENNLRKAELDLEKRLDKLQEEQASKVCKVCGK